MIPACRRYIKSSDPCEQRTKRRYFILRVSERPTVYTEYIRDREFKRQVGKYVYTSREGRKYSAPDTRGTPARPARDDAERSHRCTRLATHISRSMRCLDSAAEPNGRGERRRGDGGDGGDGSDGGDGNGSGDGRRLRLRRRRLQPGVVQCVVCQSKETQG